LKSRQTSFPDVPEHSESALQNPLSNDSATQLCWQQIPAEPSVNRQLAPGSAEAQSAAGRQPRSGSAQTASGPQPIPHPPQFSSSPVVQTPWQQKPAESPVPGGARHCWLSVPAEQVCKTQEGEYICEVKVRGGWQPT
jgi:hypothetical protein